jgi:hypothetical protein
MLAILFKLLIVSWRQRKEPTGDSIGQRFAASTVPPAAVRAALMGGW